MFKNYFSKTCTYWKQSNSTTFCCVLLCFSDFTIIIKHHTKITLLIQNAHAVFDCYTPMIFSLFLFLTQKSTSDQCGNALWKNYALKKKISKCVKFGTKSTHFEKNFQSALNLRPTWRTLKIFFKVRNFSKCVLTDQLLRYWFI